MYMFHQRSFFILAMFCVALKAHASMMPELAFRNPQIGSQIRNAVPSMPQPMTVIEQWLDERALSAGQQFGEGFASRAALAGQGLSTGIVDSILAHKYVSAAITVSTVVAAFIVYRYAYRYYQQLKEDNDTLLGALKDIAATLKNTVVPEIEHKRTDANND